MFAVVHWWKWYLGIGCLVVLVGTVLSTMERQGLYEVTGASAIVAIIAGVRRHKPLRTWTWRLYGAAVGCSVGAALLWAVQYARTGDVPFPSAKDVLFVATYPLMGVGLYTFVRRDPQRQRWEGLVDAAIMASGVAPLTFTAVIHPFLTSHRFDGPHLASYTLYALLDLAILVLLGRLVFNAGDRSPSYWFVVGAVLALLVGDTVYYMTLALGGDPTGGRWPGVLWLGCYVLIGTAALHPTMATTTGQLELIQSVTTRYRLTMYAVLAIIGPGVTAVALLQSTSDRVHLLVPLGTAVANTALLVVRINMLIRVAHRRAADLDAQTHALSAALREQEGLRQQLTHRALHDALTGLGNRSLLQERVEHALHRGGGHGLLLIDLDGFKDVNDSFGHPTGDALLIEVASRLLAVVGNADTLARLGGDEFAILVEDAAVGAAADIGRAIVEQVRRPFTINSRELSLTASVGVLPLTSSLTMPEALRNVDLALYAAKAAGKNQVIVYEQRLADERLTHMRLTNDLRRAVLREEFTVHYQPVVDLTSGRVTAVEALLRWSPDGAPVPPDEFIPVAEQAGLIVPIGAWVLRRACRDVVGWYERYGIAVTVNVSGRQLREPEFVDTVVAALADSGLPGSALVLEITETVLVASTTAEANEVTARLSALRVLGVRIAVDDFGTGYSSLAYLRHLPVDILKIDRAFTTEATGAELTDEIAFTRAILELGSSLRLQSIAEAVETSEQADRLRELHCPLAQGYHFSRPLPAGDLDQILTLNDATLKETAVARNG